MRLLRQSTATTIKLGPAVDVGDGATPETGLSPTVYISKGDAALAARNSAGPITHDRDGYYQVPLDTTDTGALGSLVAEFEDAATHLPVNREFMVMPQDLYDALHSSSFYTADGAEQVTPEGITKAQAWRLILAALLGPATGMDTGSPVIKAADGGDAGPTLAAGTADAYGNRSSITLTPDAS